MRIISEDSYIEFEFEEAHENYISCHISVFSEGFSGKVQSVWFHESEVKDFIRQLEQFEKIRKDSVELVDMSSPSDSSPLKFKIFSTDSLGHIAVSISLKKINYSSSKSLKTSISFDIDSGVLITIIRDFKKLFMV